MSRYLLLFLLNAPFVLAALLSTVTRYKLRKITRRRALIELLLWAIILAGLIIAQPLYEWLYSQELTKTEPLSLFDVIQITAIVITFYIANRTRAKLEETEQRLSAMHQELSIRLSRSQHHN